ncbi:MAG: type II toxin-antitoxin system VapB family antitoxin [Burkholderiaceae bacterium]|nr:type II toxin-antitoxin system VapB family antitoxin [Burkholderiaceae bacterium]
MECDLFIKKLPRDIKELIAREAQANRRSVNQEAIVLLEEALTRRARFVTRQRHAVQQILASYRALPITDNRTPDEIIGYDENGLPT